MKKIILLTVLVLFYSSVNHAEKMHIMKVHGAVCASCAYGLEKKFKKFDGVKTFDVDFTAGTVSICTDENLTFTEKELSKIFVESGYTFKGEEVKSGCAESQSSSHKKSILPIGENVSVTGIYNGMCDDGEDFYFVYKSDVLEVMLPANGMPKNLKVGAPLNIQGKVIKHGDEIKIEASSIKIN